MIEKVGHVKNPLTIIAIFAGLAEVCGTLMLPLMEIEVQKIFVWFLIVFPSALIVAFFVTLWKKHTVLYAPSDFRSDQAFESAIAQGMQQRTSLEKIKQEAAENLRAQEFSVSNSAEGGTDTDPHAGNDDDLPAEGNVDINTFASGDRSQEAIHGFIADQIALDAVSRSMNLNLKRNISFSNSGKIIDAVHVDENRVVAVEVKKIPVSRKMTRLAFASSVRKRIYDAIATLEYARDHMPDVSASRFEGVACIVVEGRYVPSEYVAQARAVFESVSDSKGVSMNLKFRLFQMWNEASGDGSGMDTIGFKEIPLF